MAIDIGEEAKDRLADKTSGDTLINMGNPANASGTITSVEIWCCMVDLSGCKVGIFYTINGNTLNCRSAVTIGDVTKGSKQTFPLDPALAVVAGDYIGMYWAGGYMEMDRTGYGGIWRHSGDYCIVNGEHDYTPVSGDAVSLYGTGEEEAPPAVGRSFGFIIG